MGRSSPRQSFMKILTALSGGVDSAAAAHLLREAGYDVRGVSFKMHETPGGEDPTERARAVADAMGIPFIAADVTADFCRLVIADFIAEYKAGRTPNPCVVCNRTVKFPFLTDYADRLEIDRCATGHYARILRVGDRYTVGRAADSRKDQTYMLWGLSQETLRRLVLPLGEYTKEQIREIAREADLPAAGSKESQDICFIPHGDYTAYLREAGVPLPDGIFTDEAGAVLGKSKNQACYTVGQRRGLGIALGQYMYVSKKDAANNRTVLTPADPHARTVRAAGINFLAAAPGDLTSPRKLTVKLRYTRAEHACEAWTEGDTLTVRLAEPVRAPAAGQSLVLYDGDSVVAGGIIEDWEG